MLSLVFMFAYVVGDGREWDMNGEVCSEHIPVEYAFIEHAFVEQDENPSDVKGDRVRQEAIVFFELKHAVVRAYDHVSYERYEERIRLNDLTSEDLSDEGTISALESQVKDRDFYVGITRLHGGSSCEIAKMSSYNTMQLGDQTATTLAELQLIQLSEQHLELGSVGNPQYQAYFELDSQQQGTLIEEVKLPRREGQSSSSLLQDTIRSYPSGRTYLEVLQDPTTEVSEWQEGEIDGKLVKRVIFREKIDDDFWTCQATFWAHNGCPRELVYVVDRFEMRCRFSYQDPQLEIPVLERYRQEVAIEQRQLRIKNVVYKNVRLGESQDEAIFYLTHYGLPEPEWVDANFRNRFDWPRWLIISLVGLALLGIGTWFKRRASKNDERARQLRSYIDQRK